MMNEIWWQNGKLPLLEECQASIPKLKWKQHATVKHCVVAEYHGGLWNIMAQKIKEHNPCSIYVYRDNILVASGGFSMLLADECAEFRKHCGLSHILD